MRERGKGEAAGPAQEGDGARGGACWATRPKRGRGGERQGIFFFFFFKQLPNEFLFFKYFLEQDIFGF